MHKDVRCRGGLKSCAIDNRDLNIGHRIRRDAQDPCRSCGCRLQRYQIGCDRDRAQRVLRLQAFDLCESGKRDQGGHQGLRQVRLPQDGGCRGQSFHGQLLRLLQVHQAGRFLHGRFAEVDGRVRILRLLRRLQARGHRRALVHEDGERQRVLGALHR